MVVFERGATELIGYSAPNMSAVGTYPVPLHQVRPSTINPRKQFDQAKLVELAEGIMRHGLLEPIVVRVATAAAIDDGRGEIVLYEIVAGERRYRATWLVALARCMGEPVAEVVALSEEAREAFREQAGREFIEARNLGEVPDGVALELALVENLQRADLDPIEEAEGYAALNRVAGLSQSAIGKAVNRSQPAIANAMRLLDLPDDVRERIRVGKLSASHGVALAKWKQYPEFVSKLAENAAKHGYTSKQMEQVEPGDYMANGAAERLHGGNGFDSAVCAGCPFGAYIPSKQQYSYDRGYCMKPSHFKQLREEAEAERLAAHEAKAAEKIGAEEAAALPKLAGMKYDTYRDLRSHTTPPGCSADCECRAKGIGEGGRVVAICTNPKRFTSLQNAKERAERKAKREEKAARLQEALAAVDRLTSRAVEKHELVLLVESILTSVGNSQSAVFREALKRQAPALDADTLTDYHRDREAKRLRALGKLSESQLIRLGVEMLLRRDNENQFGEYTHGGYITDWYLKGAEASPEIAGAVADD